MSAISPRGGYGLRQARALTNFLEQVQPKNGGMLILLGLAIFLGPALTLPLSRGEAFYALVPSEMLAAGRWIAITLNGAPFLDKPQLPFWFNLVAFKIWGVSDWSARLPTLAVTVAEVWMTYCLGRLLLKPRAAWLAGFILLSSPGYFYLHLELFADHFVTLSLIFALYFLVRWLKDSRPAWVYLFHLCMALGFLSKGIVGLGFPLVIGLLYTWQLGQLRRFRRLILHPGGLAVLALIIGPWFVVMVNTYPGFLRHFFIDEHILRFLGERQPGGVSSISAPLLWLFLGIWLMPWMVLLPQALYLYIEDSRGGESGREKLLFLIWPAVVLAVFTLSLTRIEYYTLPALPALGLILGWRVDRCLSSPRDHSLAISLLAIGLITLGATVLMHILQALCVGNRQEFTGIFPRVMPVARQATLVLPGLCFLAALWGWRRRYLALAGYGLVALISVFFAFQALTALVPVRSDKLAGEYIRNHALPGDVVVMANFKEAELGSSLAFYARRRILMVQRHGLPRFLYPIKPQENYLISPARLKKLWQGPHRVFFLVDEATPLAQYLKGAPVVLAGGGKRLLVNRPLVTLTQEGRLYPGPSPR
jgi:4-amino-4-deoxy-L-arabinose transferase-like glycosyltransferase